MNGNQWLTTDKRRSKSYPLFSIHWLVLTGLLTTGFVQKPPFTVFIFLDTECPICQQTVRRVQELANQYPNRVQFEAVYPTETVTLADIKAFEQTYQLTIPHQPDSAHKRVKQYGATTTPEVILVSPQNRILYRGSVDNQFYRLGRSRPAPTEFYLRDALAAVLTNKPVMIRQTTPTGCLINRN